MKKFLLSLCVSLLALGAAAQEGQIAAGVHIGVAPVLSSAYGTNFGIGAKVQYNVTNPLRVEFAGEYWAKASAIQFVDFAINAHYLYNITNNIRLYPIVGLGYANIKYSYKYNYSGGDYGEDVGRSDNNSISYSSSWSRMLLNLGAGVEYDLTNQLVLDVELKSQSIKDFSRIPITVGVAYKF